MVLRCRPPTGMAKPAVDAMAPERITGVLMRSVRPPLAVPVALRAALTTAAAGHVPTLARCTGLAACLALVACSGPAAEVQLPARPTATPSMATSRAVLTPRQQVVSALTGYTTALGAADRSM